MKKKIQDPISIDHDSFQKILFNIHCLQIHADEALKTLELCKMRPNPSVRKIKREKI